MYAYLMTSWEELPEQNKRALGFDSIVGGEEEEAALNRLATLFMEYADVSCAGRWWRGGGVWGGKVIERRTRHLKELFPNLRDWSASNLKYPRFCAPHCPDLRFGQRADDQTEQRRRTR